MYVLETKPQIQVDGTWKWYLWEEIRLDEAVMMEPQANFLRGGDLS